MSSPRRMQWLEDDVLPPELRNAIYKLAETYRVAFSADSGDWSHQLSIRHDKTHPLPQVNTRTRRAIGSMYTVPSIEIYFTDKVAMSTIIKSLSRNVLAHVQRLEVSRVMVGAQGEPLAKRDGEKVRTIVVEGGKILHEDFDPMIAGYRRESVRWEWELFFSPLEKAMGRRMSY